MELNEALAVVRSTGESVLATMRKNGRPQLSNVMHAVDEDGVIRISTTVDRAKYLNLRRDPWAALHANGENFYSYVVLECDAELSPEATSEDAPVVEELIGLYRARAGEHDDWDDYRRAMVEERRAVVRLRPTRAYGLVRDFPLPRED